MALQILQKKALPSTVFVKHQLITPRNVDLIYPLDDKQETKVGFSDDRGADSALIPQNGITIEATLYRSASAASRCNLGEIFEGPVNEQSSIPKKLPQRHRSSGSAEPRLRSCLRHHRPVCARSSAGVRYADVKLTGGPLKQQYDRIHAHYLALDDDRLLKVYRERAGLPAPGKDMGGWYDLNGFVPGHSLGQYISGLARIGASTGDTACHAKVAGSGRRASPRRSAPTTNPSCGPKPTCGSATPSTNTSSASSMHSHSQTSPKGTELLNRVLAGSASLLPAQGTRPHRQKRPALRRDVRDAGESLHRVRANRQPARSSDLALKYMLDREYFDPLANGENPFPGQHAYSHAIALSSAGKAYLFGGDRKIQARACKTPSPF